MRLVTMRAIIFFLLLSVILSHNEANSNELHCDFATEQRIVEECLAPFLDKLDFGQFFFGRKFVDVPLILCKLYDGYHDCINKYREECRTLNTRAEHFFNEICSDGFKNEMRAHRLCFNNFQDYFIYSPDCFHNSMFQSDHETILFRSEHEHSEIKNPKCSFVQWYLNCSLTDAYVESCPVAAEMIQRYYELLLNANQSACNLRRINSNLMGKKFTDLENTTETSEIFLDVSHPERNSTNERCDIASERYAMGVANELRKLENFGYQFFQTSYQEFIQRTPCQAYRKYKKKVENISPDCRKMNIHLEKIYDYYCSDEFADLLLNQQNCVAKLQEVYNESDCSNVAHFQNEYDAVFQKDTSDLLTRRCKFVKWYISCGIIKSFSETCPQIAEGVKTFFEILLNANKSNCDLRQQIANYNENITGHNCQTPNNCTITDCPEGYYYEEQTAQCIDVDECASNKHSCSQKCINIPGGYKCQCFEPLYRLARNGRRCYRTSGEPVTFFLAHSQNIWNVTYDGKSSLKMLPNDGIEKVAMFDYDFKEKKLYYVDLIKSLVQYVFLSNKNIAFTVQNHDIEGTEGIAVDWIHRNLYTLRQQQLHVQRLNGHFRTSLYKGFFRLPRALVVYPQIRELFATDWSMKPFIARLAMDGSQAKKIVTEDLVWPNALAIDYFAERLYWADAFRDTVEMANLDGTGRRAVITNSWLVPHVFGLTIFDDTIFWSDWTNRGLLFADKLTGRNSTLLLIGTATPPYSIKAYHSFMQISGKNICLNTTCQHICVPKLDGSGPQCLCADGFIMHKDGTCEPNCNQHEFLCPRPYHKCLNLMHRCDGTYNCDNGADELGCPLPICLQDERMFPCRDNRKCILRSQRCDGIVDCHDHSDELYCADLAMDWTH